MCTDSTWLPSHTATRTKCFSKRRKDRKSPRMGKKGKRKAQQGLSSPRSTEGISHAQEKEILSLCQKVFEFVSLETPVLPVKLWEEHLKLRELVEKIREKQAGISWFEKDSHSRTENVDNFVKWFNEHDGQAEGVVIDDFNEQGLGLKAVNEIKAGELFVTIPRKLMMSAETAKSSELGPLIEKDNILRVMQNACLVLHVYCEKVKEASFWKPYLDILPSSYSTTLYFSVEEMQALKGSPAFGEALKLYRNIARQYAYLYRRLNQDCPETARVPLKNNFTYDDHRWAVSTVITRQNKIPSTTGEPTLALIPMWDMCNHSNGTITTGYDMVEDCCKSLSVKNFQIGQQVCIFYGERSNADLLVHNGFVFEDNFHDKVCIQLGVSKNDPLYQMKDQLLTAVKMTASSHWYPVHCGDQPVRSDLIAFLRIFSMDEDELKKWLKKAGDESTNSELKKLSEVNSVAVCEETEIKCWQFLETRLTLLLAQYKTSNKEERDLLENPAVSEHIKLCVRLKRAERIVLQNAAKYAATMKNSVKSTGAESEENRDIVIDKPDEDATQESDISDISDSISELNVDKQQ